MYFLLGLSFFFYVCLSVCISIFYIVFLCLIFFIFCFFFCSVLFARLLIHRKESFSYSFTYYQRTIGIVVNGILGQDAYFHWIHSHICVPSAHKPDCSRYSNQRHVCTLYIYVQKHATTTHDGTNKVVLSIFVCYAETWSRFINARNNISCLFFSLFPLIHLDGHFYVLQF